MSQHRIASTAVSLTAGLAMVALVAACGSDGSDGGGGSGQGGGVAGVMVVHQDVEAAPGDALGGLPLEFAGSLGGGFDRSLAFADWAIDGLELGGVTDAEGRFAIDELEPGSYTMRVTKTVDGDLMLFDIPFVVGDDGSAQVIAEVAWGRVRATSIYTRDGSEMRESFAPGGAHVVIRNGQIAALSDQQRTLVDEDGDGFFEPGDCVEKVWSCAENGECGPGRRCSCIASCPFCDDCGPPVCLPLAVSPFPPYRCNDDGSCDLPGDHCICVSSCEDCGDCGVDVCVPSCEPLDIVSIDVQGPQQLTVGQRRAMAATATLSDGSSVYVTPLADWASSAESVLRVDAWGSVEAVGVGTGTVTAALGDIVSDGWPVEVVGRPPLRRIYLQNASCFEWGAPISDLFAPPSCTRVVLVGEGIQFAAMGEFEDGSFADITDDVEWRAEPPGVGGIEGGLFIGLAAGTAHVSASLDGVTSDELEVLVVTERAITALSIYPEYDAVLFLDFFAGMPCVEFGCGMLTLLSGDERQFRATAYYDTGGWGDVTGEVTWRTSDPAVAAIGAGGLLTAVAAGEATIDATLDGFESNPFGLRVVDEAVLVSLYIHQEGHDRVVEQGGQAFFRASGTYDVGFGRDVTEEAVWHSSDEAVGGFEEPGVFTGRAAGDVEVWAELGGQRSAELHMEVFETSDIEYCDAENINRGTWTDGFNRVVLESDCAEYTPPGVVALRFTVTETERPGGIFDPCLDLFAFDGERLVRTIREEGCGEPFLPAAGLDVLLRYQLRAFWDLKDDSGTQVAPGTYTIYGRFYLYYDPVVSIDITVH